MIFSFPRSSSAAGPLIPPGTYPVPKRFVSALAGMAIACLAGGCGNREDQTAAVNHGESGTTEGADQAMPAISSSSSSSSSSISEQDSEAHARMEKVLAELHPVIMANNVYYGHARVRQLEVEINAVSREQEPQRYVFLLQQLGQANVDYGNLEAGIRQLQATRDILNRFDAPEELRREAAFRLGVANLRLAETENCCASWSAGSCILPLQGAAIHKLRRGSEAAIVCFGDCMRLAGNNEPFRLLSQWLLNLAYMTLGEWPEGTPEAVRLPASLLESDTPFPRFANVAGNLGLATDSLAGGAVAEDFDGDGDFDLLVSSWESGTGLRYFENRLPEGFVDRSEAAGVSRLTGGLNMVQADYDNDGDTDVFVLRGAWLGSLGEVPNSLLCNDGNGVFHDVTFPAGLAEVNYPTQTAAWFDYDNDGAVDLYIGNEQWEGQSYPCQLFRNMGDGTFRDMAGPAGVANNAFTKAVVCGDIDNDRWPDILVSNLGTPNRLFRNNRDGTFTDIAASAGIGSPMKSFPALLWDFDNDGNLDAFISSYTGSPEDLVRKATGKPFIAERSGHYRGDGHGGFTDLAEPQGFDMPMLTMGSNFGDLNNDGFPDLYLGTGDPDIYDIMPNTLFLNQAGQGFADVTMASGLGHLQKGHAVVFADFDQDGDQDIFEQMGGAKRVDAFRDALYENPGFGNHWVGVHLVGTSSNRSAIGARIRAEFEENGKSRSVYRHVNSGGSFGANPLRQHIGIGTATSIAVLEVWWPKTGETQVFRQVPADTSIRITEGSATLAQSTLRPRPFPSR